MCPSEKWTNVSVHTRDETRNPGVTCPVLLLTPTGNPRRTTRDVGRDRSVSRRLGESGTTGSRSGGRREDTGPTMTCPEFTCRRRGRSTDSRPGPPRTGRTVDNGPRHCSRPDLEGRRCAIHLSCVRTSVI